MQRRGHWAQPALDIKANGVNATKGTLGTQYATMSIVNTLSRWQEEQGVTVPIQETSVLNLYNPTLNFRNYMIPALMVVLLIIICGFLPTLNLVSEHRSDECHTGGAVGVRFVETDTLLGGRYPCRNGRDAHRLAGLRTGAGREYCEYLSGGCPVQPCHVRLGRVHRQPIDHYPAEHLRDVCFHRHLPADGRSVHAYCLHAPVGAVHHLRHPAALFHRNHALGLSERSQLGRPMDAVCGVVRFCHPVLPRGDHDVQEAGVDN